MYLSLYLYILYTYICIHIYIYIYIFTYTHTYWYAHRSPEAATWGVSLVNASKLGIDAGHLQCSP